MSRNYRIFPVCVMLAASLVAAAEPPAGTTGRDTGIAPPKRIPDVISETATPAGDPVGIASVPRATRRAVVADAARRFGVAQSAVVLARAEQVTWPDGSLGCPEPGRRYTQAPVPGFRLTARTTAGELLYHADRFGNVVNCALPGKPPHEALKDRDTRVTPRAEPPPAAPDR
jgi:hypothetical protein